LSADELLHIIRHAASGLGEPQPFRYGYISTYDATQHRVRCIIPSMTDQDGTPLLSPWMPLGTPYAANGAGIQVIYHGGATETNPTAGEQCLIALFDPRRGVSAVPCTFFHANAPPPATNLPSQQDGYPADASPNAGGDIIISALPANSGGANSVVRIRQSGNIEIWCAGQTVATVIGDLDLTTTTGNVNVTVSKGNATVSAMNGTVNIIGSAIRLSKAVGDALQALCNATFQTVFNAHVHGTSPPPTPQAGANTVTTVLTAE
jgi:phage terminase large subunit-like protein